MRISPQDIRQQQFSTKWFRGFDPQEVDAFLEDVAEDYEAVLKELAILREQVAVLEERSRGVAELERTLQDTLVTTQRLTEEMKATARREAQLIVQEAEVQSEKVLEAARTDEARTRAELEMLKRTRRQAVEDFRAMLERYQRMVTGDVETLGDAGDEPE